MRKTGALFVQRRRCVVLTLWSQAESAPHSLGGWAAEAMPAQSGRHVDKVSAYMKIRQRPGLQGNQRLARDAIPEALFGIATACMALHAGPPNSTGEL